MTKEEKVFRKDYMFIKEDIQNSMADLKLVYKAVTDCRRTSQLWAVGHMLGENLMKR